MTHIASVPFGHVMLFWDQRTESVYSNMSALVGL